jgi:mono/diheme cytochrome c family protein
VFTRNRFISLLIALSLLLIFIACNPNPQPPGLTPIPTLAQAATVELVGALQGAAGAASTQAAVAPGQADAAAGAAIYLKNCSSCHGVQAQGDVGPALRNSQFIKTAGDNKIFETIANGRTGTGMPAWLQANGGPLNEADINNVIAYLKTLQGLSALPTLTPVPEEPTETPLPPNAPTPEAAEPSLPGGPGPAASLAGDASRGLSVYSVYCSVCHGPEGVQGVPNPGSEDGSVPPLNPIDPTIANSDPKLFAAHLDVFIEHGSVPEGSSPRIMMPSFGDTKLLTDQQIADVIAYLIKLNSGK